MSPSIGDATNRQMKDTARRQPALLARLLIPAIAPCLVIGSVDAHTQISGELVKRAILGGVNYLLKKERAGRFWERGVRGQGPEGSFSERGGETALAVEALLYVEQTLHLRRLNIIGPALKPAIAMLCRIKPTGTYAVSYRANALALLPLKPPVKRRLRWDELYLERSIHRNGAYSYAYFDSRRKDQVFATASAWDNSNSQYGVLGMRACVHALQRSAPYRYWRLVEQHWIQTQFADGCWGYWGFAGSPPSSKPSAWRRQSMTPAGVASLLIADEYMQMGRNAAVQRGLRWINANYPPADTNGYAMYGFERVGLASGLSTFGGHNWYRDFVRTLINNQNSDGSWGGGFLDSDTISGTAYALVIFDRGLNPFLMNKLDDGHHYYGTWNRYPRDVANLASWVSRSTDFPVNWRVVTFRSKRKAWLSAPIPYITGSRPPVYTAREQKQLRRYINAGGMVVCACTNASQAYQRAMIKLGQHVMDGRYEFTRLTPACTLYKMQPWYRNFFINAYGMSNGSRYLWIVVPEDLSRVWQRHLFSVRQPWIFAENLYLYCTGKGELTNRLQSLYVPAPKEKPHAAMRVVQLKYPVNWDPEPSFAWRRYARLAQSRFEVGIRYAAGGSVPTKAAKHTLAYLTGTASIKLPNQQMVAIRRFMAAGVTLLVDCTGGHTKTAQSVRQLIGKLAPGYPLKRIKTSGRLLNGSEPHALRLEHISYRKYHLQSHHLTTRPQIYGIRRSHRWIIIFSPLDVTSGLLGIHTWGINGYSPGSSVSLMRDITAYAAGGT